MKFREDLGKHFILQWTNSFVISLTYNFVYLNYALVKNQVNRQSFYKEIVYK